LNSSVDHPPITRAFRWLAAGAMLALSFGPIRNTCSATTIDSRTLSLPEGKWRQVGRPQDFEFKTWSRKLSALVVIAHGNVCPVLRQNHQAFTRIRSRYQKEGVGFVMINSVRHDQLSAIEQEMREYKIAIPIIHDPEQKLLQQFGYHTVGQVLVFQRKESGWQLQYSGGIDDRVNFDRALPQAQNKYLEDTLDELLSKKPVGFKSSPIFGCAISIDKKQDATNR